MNDVVFIGKLAREVHRKASVATLACIAAIIIVTSTINVAQPFTFKLLIDILAGHLVFDYALEVIVAAYVGFLAMARSMRYLYQPVFTKYTLALQKELGVDSLSHMMRLPYQNLISREVHSLPKILADANLSLHNLVTALLEMVLPIALEVTFILVIVALHFGTYALVVSAFGIVCFLIVTLVGSRLIQKDQTEYTIQGNRNFEIISESISNFETIRALNGEKVFVGRYLDGLAKYIDLCIRFFVGSCAIGVAQVVVLGTNMLLLMFYVLEMYEAGDATVGNIVLINLYTLQLVAPLQNLAVAYRYWRQSIVELRIRHEVMRMGTEGGVKETGVVSKRCAPSIEFKDVSFKYEDSRKQALRNVSFKLGSGEKLAIVGPSGCGKSTILRLLLRYVDDFEGKIRINGVDIRTLNRQSIRSIIGLVPQDVVLFDDDLAFNVSLGSGPEDRERVSDALLGALAREVEEEIGNRAAGLAGNRGGRLSGGERQRIGVARALYRDSTLLVFDEPTSAVDNLTEGGFVDLLEKVSEDKSVVVISHRIKVARACDRILVLEGGGVVQFGTDAELRRRGGLYSRLLASEG